MGLTTTELINSSEFADIGEISIVNGFYTDDDCGHGEWIVTGNVIEPNQTPAMTGKATFSNNNGVERRLVNTSHIDVRQLGAKLNKITNDTPAINAALVSGSRVFNPGIARLDEALEPQDNTEFYGVLGQSQLWQFGQAAIKQNTGNLKNFNMHDILLDFKSPSASRYDEAISLCAYKGCTFENLDFVRYDDQTIIYRAPIQSSTINSIDNVHRNWNVSACANLDIAIGLEGYYHKHTGNAVDKVIDTGIEWPEQFNSSVIVMKENQNRKFLQMALYTDYTVSYDAENKLTITLVNAASTSERIHIWPAQPRTDGNRRPFSNNLWEDINCDYIFISGHTAVRWVDAEDYVYERMTAASNYVKLYEFNPFDERNGQGGDFMNFNGCVLTYQAKLVTNPKSLIGINMGPGSVFNYGAGIRGDLLWRHGTENKLIQCNDKETVTLVGTVTTNGSNVITGNDTKFRDQLTLVGDVGDVIIINGNKYGIASIDSDTKIIATSNVPALTNVSIARFNLQNTVSYDMAFAASGEGQSNAKSKSTGHYVMNSGSVDLGEAKILNGQYFVDVPFKLSRMPRKGEISINNFSGMNGRTTEISNVTSTSFRIKVNTPAAANYDFGWKIELMEIN